MIARYVDRVDVKMYARLREEARQQRALHGHDHGPAPEEFTEAPLSADAPICALCHKQVFEVRPFGPNHESICEECADKDPAMTAERMRGLGLDG